MTDSLRLTSHPVLNLAAEIQKKVTIRVDDKLLEVPDGEILAASLWANGLISLGHNPSSGSHRGMYCGIGHCYECRVTIDGMEDQRSCLIRVRDGMMVTLQRFEA